VKPNTNHNKKSKNTKHKAISSETQSIADKIETEDPSGVYMPPETEMSPPQFG